MKSWRGGGAMSGVGLGMVVVGRKPFQGLRVFLPRNYLPLEKYSALQDALTHQGAEVFLNLNPYSKSSVDYHVLADELKVKDMLEKGCRVVGVECVLRCAREGKRLPDRDYTCCLALDGVSVHLTGFLGEEKKQLEDLISSMGGMVHEQAVADFVVAKDALAAKGKVSCPVLMVSWLRECAREHRQVAFDVHRLLPLAGLTICATGIVFEDRYRIQEAAEKNGAAYHADLTKECSHLVALVPEGLKYEAAVKWGLKVVCQRWFWESIKQKMSLDETLFPVEGQELKEDVGGSPSPASKDGLLESKEPETDDAERRRISVGGVDAMYLSACRVFLTGFSAGEMRKVVNLVLAGGGTRYMEMNDTVTHVILGPNVDDMKEIRQLAMWGAVYVLQPRWLEECARQRREVETELYRVPQNVLLQGEARVARFGQSGRGGGGGGLADGEVYHEDPASERIGLPRQIVSKLFLGRVFGFADGFPADQRSEIVRSVVEHGGVWEASGESAKYVLAPHGVIRMDSTMVTYVSKYWISWCVEEGKLLDVQSHTLFRPLPCHIPLAGLHGARLCVSQYSERDRRLLKKLCQVLKLKFTETLNSKVTHLLCKVQAGEKYENAERLKIPCVTADWLYACAAQNMAVCLDSFRPREPTAAEKEAEHSFMTQRAGQQVGSYPGELQTQVSNQSFPGPSQTLMTFASKSTKQTSRASKVPVRRSNRSSGTSADYSRSSQALAGTHLDPWDASAPSVWGSKVGVKLSQESISQLKPVTGRSSLRPSAMVMQSGDGLLNHNSGERSVAGSSKAQETPVAPEMDSSEADHENEALATEPSCVVNVEIAGAVESSVIGNNDNNDDNKNNNSDDGTANVVDAIEGLLRQTSEGKRVELVEVMEVHKDLISPEAATLGRRTREETHTHPDSFKKPKLYPTTRSSKVEGVSPTLAPNQVDNLRFDESQLDSQMVAYDEDHSERQNLMERVRTRSSSSALSSISSVGARQSDKSAASWKGDQKLGRLFKAAEANK